MISLLNPAPDSDIILIFDVHLDRARLEHWEGGVNHYVTNHAV